MVKLDSLFIVVFFECVIGHGSIKLKPANITCRGGPVQGSLSYNVTAVPGCSQDSLPTVNCSDIPAGPVNYTGSCHGNMFHYVWEARNDVGGSYNYLKGFKMVLWVQDGLQYPYQLGHCYFVHILPPAQSQTDNRLQGQFSLQCSYQDRRRIFVISILSSYPTPEDCYGNQENPRWKMINLTVPEPASTLVLTTTTVMVPFITDLDVTETYTSELVYGSVAAGVSIVLIVCLVICFKHRKKARAGHDSLPAVNSCPGSTTLQTQQSPPAKFSGSCQDVHYTVAQSSIFDSPAERAVQNTRDATPTNVQLIDQPTGFHLMAPTDLHLMEQRAVSSSVSLNAPQKCKQGSNCREESKPVTTGTNMKNLCHRHAAAYSKRTLSQSLNALPHTFDETQSKPVENRDILQVKRDASKPNICETQSYVGDTENKFTHRTAEDTVQTSVNHCHLHGQCSQQNFEEICTFPKETTQDMFQLPDEIREELAAINDSDNDSTCV